jgi:putative transposase
MMPFDPPKYHRRSIRLPGYDYTQPGAYFITLVTWQRKELFGQVVDGETRLNEFGKIAREEWLKTAALRPNVALHGDEFVVMPNHVHGIIWIVEDVGVGAQRPLGHGVDLPCKGVPLPETVERFGKPVSASIPTILRAYKSAVTHRINVLRGTTGAPIWQRNYYEHVVRDDKEFWATVNYIRDNPLKWQEDRENPALLSLEKSHS